jgi:inner membrane protein
LQRALTLKIGLVVLAALLLQIPVEMIRGLVAERKQARDGVLADIARGASEAQRIAGPVLYIPYARRTQESTSSTDEGGRTRVTTKEKIERGHVALLPDRLDLTGSIDLQEKHRSLYKAQLYTLSARLRGTFTLPAGLGIQAEAGLLELGRAQLVLGILDTRGIRDRISLRWDDTEPRWMPGGLEAAGLPSGVHADLGVLGAATKGPQTHEFRIELTLLGTQRLDIVPVGAASTVALDSRWPHPSFQGRILPDGGTTASKEGFAATWRTSHFATNLEQLYQRCTQAKQCDAFLQHSLGIAFYQPVDLYQTVERSVKYGFLFILLTFGTIFLFEILKGLAIHPVQYALVGLALAVFFLLLISLSEHIGFAGAYAIATAACVALIGYYLRHVLQGARRGLAFAGALAALYGVLYVLLRSEDHALLAGALLVFACLAAAMVATRRVDWYAIKPESRTSM